MIHAIFASNKLAAERPEEMRLKALAGASSADQI